MEGDWGYGGEEGTHTEQPPPLVASFTVSGAQQPTVPCVLPLSRAQSWLVTPVSFILLEGGEIICNFWPTQNDISYFWSSQNTYKSLSHDTLIKELHSLTLPPPFSQVILVHCMKKKIVLQHVTQASQTDIVKIQCQMEIMRTPLCPLRDPPAKVKGIILICIFFHPLLPNYCNFISSFKGHHLSLSKQRPRQNRIYPHLIKETLWSMVRNQSQLLRDSSHVYPMENITQVCCAYNIPDADKRHSDQAINGQPTLLAQFTSHSKIAFLFFLDSDQRTIFITAPVFIYRLLYFPSLKTPLHQISHSAEIKLLTANGNKAQSHIRRLETPQPCSSPPQVDDDHYNLYRTLIHRGCWLFVLISSLFIQQKPLLFLSWNLTSCGTTKGHQLTTSLLGTVETQVRTKLCL